MKKMSYAEAIREAMSIRMAVRIPTCCCSARTWALSEDASVYPAGMFDEFGENVCAIPRSAKGPSSAPPSAPRPQGSAPSPS